MDIINKGGYLSGEFPTPPQVEVGEQSNRPDIITWIQNSAGQSRGLRYLFDRNMARKIAKTYDALTIHQRLGAIRSLQLQQGDPVSEAQRQHAISLYESALAQKGGATETVNPLAQEPTPAAQDQEKPVDLTAEQVQQAYQEFIEKYGNHPELFKIGQPMPAGVTDYSIERTLSDAEAAGLAGTYTINPESITLPRGLLESTDDKAAISYLNLDTNGKLQSLEGTVKENDETKRISLDATQETDTNHPLTQFLPSANRILQAFKTHPNSKDNARVFSIQELDRQMTDHVGEFSLEYFDRKDSPRYTINFFTTGEITVKYWNGEHWSEPKVISATEMPTSPVENVPTDQPDGEKVKEPLPMGQGEQPSTAPQPSVADVSKEKIGEEAKAEIDIDKEQLQKLVNELNNLEI